MKQAISIVIPALNEEKGIGNTIRSIPKAILQQMGYEVEILVIDGASKDKTKKNALEAGAEVIVESRRGYGRAIKTGFIHASGDIIVTVDADSTYPINVIPELVRILEQQKLDFLTTDRFALMEQDAMSFRNKVGNMILASEVRVLYGLNMKDPESGMWVFRKKILYDLRLDSDSWSFSHEIKIEACCYQKCRWKEIPIRYSSRCGETKLTNAWKVGLIDFCHIAKKRIKR